MKARGRLRAVAFAQLPLSLVPGVRGTRGHDLGQIQPVHVGRRLRRGHGFVDARLGHSLASRQSDDGAILRALSAQQAGQFAGVDVGDGYRLGTHEVLGQRLGHAEVAGQQRQVLDDEACGVDFFSLDILCVDAVVADVRIRQGDDLLAVAGVRENFLVAGDGGIEDHFADRGAGGTDRVTDKDRAVCERQDGGREGSLERQKHWVLRWFTGRPGAAGTAMLLKATAC